MLTEIYIEALLVDEELADQVWEAWDKGVDQRFLGGLVLVDSCCTRLSRNRLAALPC